MSRTKNKEQKKEREILKIYQQALDEVENMEYKNPEGYQKNLQIASDLYSETLENILFRLKLKNGLDKFLKRAKRRAKRKPLTLRKIQSLQDDLADLTRIFNI